MKKALLFLLAIAATSTTVWAQEAPKKNILGVRAGVRFSSIGVTYTEDDITLKAKEIMGNKTSFHVGVTDQIRLLKRRPLYLEVGLMFQEKGASVKAEYRDLDYDYVESMNAKLNMYYLEIPITLNYQFNVGRNFAIVPYAGLYYGFGIDGNSKLTYSSSDYYTETEKIDIFDDEGGYKRSDFGVRLGVGMIFGKHYHLGVGYEFSLTDIDKASQPVLVGEEDMGGSHISARNRTWTISLGYNF
jgi:opacity protein-like surface antigen